LDKLKDMRLFAFGDSYTEGYKVDAPFHPYTQYLKTLGFEFDIDSEHPYEKLPPIWTEHLSELFKCPVFNYGKGGIGNDDIFQRICQASDKFKKGDIVIINWTYLHRFLWGADKNLHPWAKPKIYNISISHQIYDELKDLGLTEDIRNIICKNRMLKSWIDVIKGYEKIIFQLAEDRGFKVYIWSTDTYYYEHIDYDIKDEKYIMYDEILKTKENHNKHPYVNDNIFHQVLDNNGAISLEVEGEKYYNSIVEDSHHRGGIGHKIQADLFYNWIKKYYNLI